MLGLIAIAAFLSLIGLFFIVIRDGFKRDSSLGDKVSGFAILSWVVMVVATVVIALVGASD